MSNVDHPYPTQPALQLTWVVRLPCRAALTVRKSSTQENALSHLTVAMLLVGAFVLIFGTGVAARAYLKNRAEEIAPFCNYFGPEYDRDLLRQSSWSDDENPYNRRTRIDAFSVRDRGATERYSSGSGTTWRNRDRD